jgi:hypothetical protein
MPFLVLTTSHKMETKMIRTLAIPAIFLFCSFVLLGQAIAAPTDIEAKLKANVVTKKGGKLTIDRFRICQLFRPQELGGGVTKTFQVKSHAEAPADIISRDNFVALLTEVGINLRVSFAKGHIEGMTPLQALNALRCKLIDAPIGAVDFEAEIHMSKDGMQLEITKTATGDVDKQTQLWSQVFGQ